MTLPTVESARAAAASAYRPYELSAPGRACCQQRRSAPPDQGGGGRLNDQPIADETATITLAHADSEGRIKLSAGKKKHVLVRAI